MSEERYIDELLTTYVGKLSRGSEAAQRALAVRYGLGAGFMVAIGDGRLSRSQRVVALSAVLGMVLWFVIALGGILLVQIAAAIDILRDPTIAR